MTNLKKEREWADRIPEETDSGYERTYRDGSLQNECWSGKGYVAGEHGEDDRKRDDE